MSEAIASLLAFSNSAGSKAMESLKRHAALRVDLNSPALKGLWSKSAKGTVRDAVFHAKKTPQENAEMRRQRNARIIEMYHAGRSYCEMADEMKMSVTTVSSVISEHGSRRPLRRLDYAALKSEWERMMAEVAKGLKPWEAARKVGMSRGRYKYTMRLVAAGKIK